MWRFYIHKISSIKDLNGYMVLSCGLNYELVLGQFSVIPAAMTTGLSVPLGWLPEGDRLHSVSACVAAYVHTATWRVAALANTTLSIFAMEISCRLLVAVPCQFGYHNPVKLKIQWQQCYWGGGVQLHFRYLCPNQNFKLCLIRTELITLASYEMA
jgi:hypothetical protein